MTLSSHRASLPALLHILLLLPFLPLSRANPASVVSGDYDCDAHQSAFTLPSPSPNANCLSLLRSPEESRFDNCTHTPCYLFLQEPPFIILPPEMLQSDPATIDRFQRPFPCGSPQLLHENLGGIAFELHRLTSSRDALCIWAGPIDNCTFNALVDFTHVMSDQYQFAVTGLLLETPQRQCTHEPSAPFIDNSMIIIGRNTAENPAAKGPFYQLMRPFRLATWGIFGAVVFLFMLVCFAIAVRFHVLRGRSLVTAFFIFAGERDQAMAYEHDYKRHQRAQRARPRRRRTSAASAASDGCREAYKRNMSFATKYGLSMTLFRISLLAFFAVFALFYEVAVVNFLFQQQALEIGKSVKSLSNSELRNYSVLQNSGLENVWHATVNPKGLKYDISDNSQIPWYRCASATQCIRWVADENHPASFVVTFEILGKYLIKQESNCNELTVFQTKDILYQFNAGWLYNRRVERDFQKLVDRELVALRINGTIRNIIDDVIGGDFSCTQNKQPDIGPLIIMVPISLFVLPPLIGSILVILCWRTAPDTEEQKSQSDNSSDTKLQLDRSGSKSSDQGSISEDINVDSVLGKASDSRVDSEISESQSTLPDGTSSETKMGGTSDEMTELSEV